LQPQVFRDEVHQVKAILDLLDSILFDLRHGGKLTSPLTRDLRAGRVLRAGLSYATSAVIGAQVGQHF
jgi:hypothetical protein